MSGSTTSRSAPTISESPVRSDVRRNRAALLTAAQELLAVDPDVPMYEVARMAGVGQATLYRHFPDRGSLVSAVAESMILALEDRAEQTKDQPDGFLTLLTEFIAMTNRSGAMVSLVTAGRDESNSELAHLRARLADLFRGSLHAAQAAGTIRPDLTDADLVMVKSMIKGALELSRTTGTAAPSERILTIILDGLRSPATRAGSGVATSATRQRPRRESPRS